MIALTDQRQVALVTGAASGIGRSVTDHIRHARDAGFQLDLRFDCPIERTHRRVDPARMEREDGEATVLVRGP